MIFKTQKMVEAVKAHALANYEKNGWDMIVECWTDQRIADAITGQRTERAAINAVAKDAKLWADQQREVCF